ncbi:hypothetical protein B0A58_03020 [Flavobacterium branchiophilum NBRC 15030 = ATCC 35035]|uniref:DUF1761 domain-containing protein n=1 Tax=Flavobacterium branchiophilum TaxID=55197 RepID=A0A2H3KXM3_9FLAO|nr:DUF1761 domain-containing protein [Flavobacterium branchiophilum]OXA79774.1 hypothetical protein B0A58_03020 [Flavobacterium branchiophilum NBRC 15030 = ATCC 35035]PDS25829.1 DUF1761 domain-containing protein [Flavobacterium branchiophilum]TQM39929.1 uncharacterized protein DUF1761 [Flavobacterium branchiophilum]GEM56134.1 hypothetical protein FB1_23550 [Flavobacterium branchiophilum NBRC 15030 = ATCC 35035]
MEMNFVAIFIAAFSSLVVGFVWYNPNVFGTIWMREAGVTEEKIKTVNMVVTLGMAFVYAVFIAFVLQFLVVHQFGAFGMIGGNEKGALPSYFAFMNDYKTAFRTFKHGALHGFMTGLFFALPVIGVGANFERRSWKYVLVSGGYWVVTCMIMGGIICAMA